MATHEEEVDPPGENEFWAKDVLAMLAGNASFVGWKVLPKHKPSLSTVVSTFGLPPELGQPGSPKRVEPRLNDFDQEYYDSLPTPIEIPRPRPQQESELSSSRSHDGHLFVPELDGMPALGLHYSPCSSADSRLASAAARERSAVPGLDFAKVRMGTDDEDEDDDDDTQQTLVAAVKHSGHDVPLINMSTLQLGSAGYGTAESSSGYHGSGIPPSRDILSSPGNDDGMMGGGLHRPPSRLANALPGKLAGAPARRIPHGAEDEASMMLHRSASAPGGAQGLGKLRPDKVDAKVKLPPLKQKQKGKRSGANAGGGERPRPVGRPIVAHVHAHHHHHYHVYPAASG